MQKHDFKFPIWFSKELRCLIKQKKIAYDLNKHSNDLKNYFEFSKLRSKCKHIRHRDYSLYTINSQREIKKYPTFFWKFVNDKSTNNHKLPNVMSYLNKEADNEKDIIHLFKNYFSDTYVSNNNTYPQSVVEENNLTPISKIQLNQIDVFNELWNINLKTAIGPDKLSPIFLQKCAFILTPVITALFNKSLETGIFPDQWKSSFITPIFKKGKKKSNK